MVWRSVPSPEHTDLSTHRPERADPRSGLIPCRMELIDFLRHLDKGIESLVHHFGPWAYAILFLVLFAETGFVVTPFLPGDTLLFAAGIFSRPELYGFNIWVILPVLTLAPICGDLVNYHIGKWLGPRLFANPNSKILNRKNLERTHEFFERYGAKTVMLARWVPIVRTFAPFVAGMSGMTFRKFFSYSVAGACVWVWVCVGAGYLFAKNTFVREHFELAMLALVIVTVIPLIVEGFLHRARQKAKASATPPES